VQLCNTVACGGNHAFNLVEFAFSDGHQQGGGVLQDGFLRGDGFVVVVQQHALFQAAAQGVVGGVFERDAVDFGDFMFGRRHAVVKLPIVGNQQHACGVGIQPSDGLDAGGADLIGQQG